MYKYNVYNLKWDYIGTWYIGSKFRPDSLKNDGDYIKTRFKGDLNNGRGDNFTINSMSYVKFMGYDERYY